MTLNATNSRTSLFTCLLLSLLTCFGCQPEAKKGADGDSTANSASTNGEVNSNESGGDSNADNSSAISGDLSSVDWESMIGQEVTISGKLVVTDTYDLIRRGQVKVARDRLYIPTNQIDPNDSDPTANSYEGGSNIAKVTESQKFNDRASIILDDGTADENIFPPTLFPELGEAYPTVRIGSVIQGVSGKLVKAGRNILLVPNEPLDWTPAERSQRPDVGEADVTVASFNVLNYFTTIDDGTNGARGADTETELQRQEAKLVAAIVAMNADVIGLMELENNLEAEKQLVAALNKTAGEDKFKACGLPEGFSEAPGGKNAIRVGIIYRADRVTPVGEVAMIRDEAFELARTPVVQSFKSKSSDKPFTVVVNHFKSKGGSNRADEANKNKGDGQGAYNATRRAQALAICNFIEQIEGEPRVLIIGDLNAYGQEDPIDAMRAKGLVDLQELNDSKQSEPDSPQHYSFIYYGQSGSLDHAMATKSLSADITGVATWHINSDEPRSLDYNEEHNPKALYQADPFRSSDHDPVLIGIRN